MSSHKPRLEIPGAYYHVGTRGNNKRSIYEDDHDREVFLRILLRVARRYGWLFYAYCLMGNHYHLAMQIGEAGISQGMCELNTAHAVTYNGRHGRVNHLFGRRFWSELITTDAHLFQVCRYVVQNPVRAGLCDQCEDWDWSSYRATIGLSTPLPFLAVDDLLEFAAPGPGDRIARFREYCATIAPARPR
jgi:putative transposase